MTREVTLYTRKQCGLCEDTAATLRRMRDELHFTIRERDIDADEDLRALYNETIPVVAIGDRVIAHAPIDEHQLETDLRAALNP